MDDGTAALAALIGSRVRKHRQTRALTLDALAQAAGVSRRMVVSVEQGEVNPSVGTLLRLADALGIGLPVLVTPDDTAPVSLTRRGEGVVLWSGPDGGRGVLLTAAQAPDVVELWEWTLASGESRDSEAHAPGTRELLHVLTGTVAIDVAGQTTVARTGDTAAFPGDVTHGYANTGRGSARFLLAVFEPSSRQDRR